LGFEIVDKVGVIVLDFDDHLTLFDTLSFDDVEMFDPSGDLGFDVGSAIEGVECDHATGADDELSPREEEDPSDEEQEDEGDGSGEPRCEARWGGQGGDGEWDVAVEDLEGGCSRGHRMFWLRR
jgi:hypothetical protein